MVVTTCSDWDFTDTVRFQNALLGLAQCQFTDDASPNLNYTDLRHKTTIDYDKYRLYSSYIVQKLTKQSVGKYPMNKQTSTT